MELTGKCKEEFEKWLGGKTRIEDKEINKWYVTWAKFNMLSNSAKYGVLVDYFDSVKYNGKGLFSQIFEMFYRDKTDDFTHNYIVETSLEECNEVYNDLADELRNEELNK